MLEELEYVTTEQPDERPPTLLIKNFHKTDG